MTKQPRLINHILTHCFVLDWSALGFGICPLGRIALSRGDAVPHVPLFLSHDAYLLLCLLWLQGVLRSTHPSGGPWDDTGGSLLNVFTDNSFENVQMGNIRIQIGASSLPLFQPPRLSPLSLKLARWPESCLYIKLLIPALFPAPPPAASSSSSSSPSSL